MEQNSSVNPPASARRRLDCYALAITMGSRGCAVLLRGWFHDTRDLGSAPETLKCRIALRLLECHDPANAVMPLWAFTSDGDHRSFAGICQLLNNRLRAMCWRLVWQQPTHCLLDNLPAELLICIEVPFHGNLWYKPSCWGHGSSSLSG